MRLRQVNSPETNVEWLTPPEMIAALGDFDLDPCTPEIMPWPTARRRYTRRDDGLSQPWFGRVFLNPPYGPHAAKWLARMREHGNGIALVPARTETRMFFDSVWGHAAGVCFVKGRPHFHYPDGIRAKTTINAPVCLIAYGKRNLAALEKCGFGIVVTAHKPAKRDP
jgi:hypothetical protein